MEIKNEFVGRGAKVAMDYYNTAKLDVVNRVTCISREKNIYKLYHIFQSVKLIKRIKLSHITDIKI